MRMATAGVVLAALLAAATAWAQAGRVEAVQYPAWLERGGQRAALVPGTELRPRDTVKTGDKARALLKLGDGSLVKLGENAQFVIEKAETRTGVFVATMRVIAGAFRFTSQELRKRDVRIQVRNVTAGIRGTDLWGKSTEERDLVCLIEGNISVQGEGHPAVKLDKPLDFYQLPRGGQPAVAKVDPKQLEEWAKETEIAKDGAAARVGGTWRVVAASFTERDKALALGRALRSRGFPAEVTRRDDQFSVEIPRLGGEAEARALASGIRQVPGVSAPEVREAP